MKLLCTNGLNSSNYQTCQFLLPVQLLSFAAFYFCVTIYFISHVARAQTDAFLRTTFDGGIGQSGNIFDLEAKATPIAILEYDVHTVTNVAENFEIWNKEGSYLGYEESDEGWKMIGCGVVIGEGYGKRTPLPGYSIDILHLDAFQRQSLYITLVAPGADLQYTAGVGSGSLYTENDHLMVFEGIGLVYPFTSIFQDRIWNGVLYYNVLDQGGNTRSLRTEISCRPSAAPSLTPTAMPSVYSSLLPSRFHSMLPTQIPSNFPTIAISEPPSRKPSFRPSFFPSTLPSFLPSRLSLFHPSSLPSQQPSLFPSSLPSRQPSSGPSSLPSRQPSSGPSSLPSQQPSSGPSSLPSQQPSIRPSLYLSQQPSIHPSPFPSQQPSLYPSLFPSVLPTRDPSMRPSNIPSSHPSLQPTEHQSNEPSNSPTPIPSLRPSEIFRNITANRVTTIQPSHYPSADSTSIPTSVPTVLFSEPPSVKPTSNQSNTPTQLGTGFFPLTALIGAAAGATAAGTSAASASAAALSAGASTSAATAGAGTAAATAGAGTAAATTGAGTAAATGAPTTPVQILGKTNLYGVDDVQKDTATRRKQITGRQARRLRTGAVGLPPTRQRRIPQESASMVTHSSSFGFRYFSSILRNSNFPAFMLWKKGSEKSSSSSSSKRHNNTSQDEEEEDDDDIDDDSGYSKVDVSELDPQMRDFTNTEVQLVSSADSAQKIIYASYKMEDLVYVKSLEMSEITIDKRFLPHDDSLHSFDSSITSTFESIRSSKSSSNVSSAYSSKRYSHSGSSLPLIEEEDCDESKTSWWREKAEEAKRRKMLDKASHILESGSHLSWWEKRAELLRQSQVDDSKELKWWEKEAKIAKLKRSQISSDNKSWWELRHGEWSRRENHDANTREIRGLEDNLSSKKVITPIEEKKVRNNITSLEVVNTESEYDNENDEKNNCKPAFTKPRAVAWWQGMAMEFQRNNMNKSNTKDNNISNENNIEGNEILNLESVRHETSRKNREELSHQSQIDEPKELTWWMKEAKNAKLRRSASSQKESSEKSWWELNFEKKSTNVETIIEDLCRLESDSPKLVPTSSKEEKIADDRPDSELLDLGYVCSDDSKQEDIDLSASTKPQVAAWWQGLAMEFQRKYMNRSGADEDKNLNESDVGYNIVL